MIEKSPELEQKDRLSLLFRVACEQKRGVVLLCDGTGIPGILHTITRLVRVLDPRHYEVHHFPETSSVEKGRPLLFRYWKDLPLRGDLAIFDGSYYHNLVQRVLSGKLTKKRLRAEIEDVRNFERMLADDGTLVFKLRFIRGKKDAQKELAKDEYSLVRGELLRDRVKTVLKHHADYAKLLRELGEKTNLPHAPWFEPPANSGRKSAGAACDYLIARLEEALRVNSRTAVAAFDEAMVEVRRVREAHEAAAGSREAP